MDERVLHEVGAEPPPRLTDTEHSAKPSPEREAKSELGAYAPPAG